MSKIKMKALELGAREILSRAQLKNVLGGSAAVCRPQGMTCTLDTDCCTGLSCSAGRCAKHCSSGSCTIAVSGHGDQPGVCETNSGSQCICRALDVPASAVSTECLA